MCAIIQVMLRDPIIPVVFLIGALFLLFYGCENPFVTPAPSPGLSNGVRQSGTSQAPWKHKGHHFKALARIQGDVRVLSTKRYYSDREAEVSPIDLACGWGRMADPKVYGKLRIWQRGRWYLYRWSDRPPIPKSEIIRTSANMHLIPATENVRETLFNLYEGQLLKFTGYLVEIRKGNWSWRSSLTRADSGVKACEVVWVETAEVR